MTNTNEAKMDINKMRAQLEKQFEEFFVEYEKKREANGWMPLEAHVLVHMRNAWFASREAVVVELPEGMTLNELRYGSKPKPDQARLILRRTAVACIEAQGLRVAP